jgi:hypothetical protein
MRAARLVRVYGAASVGVLAVAWLGLPADRLRPFRCKATVRCWFPRSRKGPMKAGSADWLEAPWRRRLAHKKPGFSEKPGFWLSAD